MSDFATAAPNSGEVMSSIVGYFTDERFGSPGSADADWARKNP
jgi:hypothetical protein